MVRRSSFETTALEMPAGFGRIHHRANLCARWVAGPAPTDRRCNPGLHHRWNLFQRKTAVVGTGC